MAIAKRLLGLALGGEEEGDLGKRLWTESCRLIAVDVASVLGNEVAWDGEGPPGVVPFGNGE